MDVEYSSYYMNAYVVVRKICSNDISVLCCQIYAVTNNIIVHAIVRPHTTLFQSKIFGPSNTPKGNKLNSAIHPLNDAPADR
jgi:hypothetical protein